MIRLNRFAKIVAIAIMLGVWHQSSAHSFEVEGIYYNFTSLTDKTVAITYRGSSSAQYSNEYSGNVTIPETVTYSGVTYSVTSIGNYAFYECIGLTSVTIPNSVTSIGGSAFYECSGLASVTIPNSVTSIGAYAFKGCSGLTSVTIPNSVTSIGAYAFKGCSGLTSVTIPNSVTSIGVDAFSNTGWYNNQPDGILYLDNCCLGYKGTNPTGELILNSNTRLIGGDAFKDCTGLTSVTIPNSVTSIENAAFYGCSGLISVTIGNSVTTMGNYTFTDCSNLELIIVLNLEPPTCYSNTFANYESSLEVPIGSLEAYKSAEFWRNFANISEVVGIEDIKADESDVIEAIRYDVHGRRLEQPTRGINIIKMSDGSTRKEFVR